MERKELAMQYFLQGYNCAQAVVLAFSDLFSVDTEALLMLSSSFGGGMGRLREVCGAVTGMFMVAGLWNGYRDPKDSTAKAKHYAEIQALAHEFEKQNGSILCRELLGLSVKRDAPVPEKRTSEYYRKRPCKELVGAAAEILETRLEEEK